MTTTTNPGLAKAHAAHAEAAAIRLADIDADRWLGIDADRIAADQNNTRTAMTKFCERHGRYDLADFFRVPRKATDRRTGTCVACGATCRNDSRRCVPCWTRWVRGDGA